MTIDHNNYISHTYLSGEIPWWRRWFSQAENRFSSYLLIFISPYTSYLLIFISPYTVLYITIYFWSLYHHIPYDHMLYIMLIFSVLSFNVHHSHFCLIFDNLPLFSEFIYVAHSHWNYREDYLRVVLCLFFKSHLIESDFQAKFWRLLCACFCLIFSSASLDVF